MLKEEVDAEDIAEVVANGHGRADDPPDGVGDARSLSTSRSYSTSA